MQQLSCSVAERPWQYLIRGLMCQVAFYVIKTIQDRNITLKFKLSGEAYFVKIRCVIHYISCYHLLNLDTALEA